MTREELRAILRMEPKPQLSSDAHYALLSKSMTLNDLVAV